jgi:hypothetical protein
MTKKDERVGIAKRKKNREKIDKLREKRRKVLLSPEDVFLMEVKVILGLVILRDSTYIYLN